QPRVHAPRQGPAGGRRQPDGGHLHGHRRRPRVPHRLRPGQRHHRRRRRAEGDLHLLRSLRGLRIPDHHVLGRLAGRHGEHPRGVLGRVDGGLRPAVLGPDPAPAAAERGDLRGVPHDRAAAPAGAVRAVGGARMRQGAGPRLRRNLTALAALSVAYLVLSIFVTNSYYQLILTLVPVWALFGVSWNILSGYGGQLSFGHASFFGIGAYAVTLALVYWNLSPWLGIPLGMILGGLAAIAIGTPTFRLRGHYFALSMLAYPLAILYVLQYLGFQEVSIPMHREHPVAFMEFSQPRAYTLIAVCLLVAGAVVSLVIENSRFGLALLAIRQNELAAEAAGINARRWKMRALVVSGIMAAGAGGLYARVLLVVTPESVFGMLVSAQAVVVTLFGGVATVWGPVIGAAVLVPLAETLQAELGTYLPGIQGVVYGAAIIAIMLSS